MWNPLTPAEVVAAMGGPTRAAARHGELLGDWERGQLLSVFSATRHLSAELSVVGPHVAEVAGRLADVAGAAGHLELAERLRAVSDGRALGDLGCELLDAVGDSSARDAVRVEVRRAVQLEVALLADAIEGPRG